uniref:Uncharacterized protein n=1 Tax=Octopus bimaculoides TaxID=37653 RepID=A0A0L8I3M0_OCTBM
MVVVMVVVVVVVVVAVVVVVVAAAAAAVVVVAVVVLSPLYVWSMWMLYIGVAFYLLFAVIFLFCSLFPFVVSYAFSDVLFCLIATHCFEL